MPRRPSLTLMSCVAVYLLVAVTTSSVPRRATSKSTLSGARPTAEAPLNAERSGYIVASS